MNDNYLVLNFDELIEYLKDIQNISYKRLAKQLGISGQMFIKWKRRDSLPSHATIIKMLDLCEKLRLKEVKFNWDAYIYEVLLSTDYEMISNIDYSDGTVEILNRETDEYMKVPVCEIEPKSIHKKKIIDSHGYCMTVDALLEYRFLTHEERWGKLQSNFEYWSRKPLNIESARKIGNIIVGMVNENVHKALEVWFGYVKNHPELYKDPELKNVLYCLDQTDYIGKVMKKIEVSAIVLEDPDLFRILVEENIYAYEYKWWGCEAPNWFKEELYFEDNMDCVSKYTDALFANQNARTRGTWYDLIYAMVARSLSFNAESESINYVLSTFKEEPLTEEQKQQLRKELNDEKIDYDINLLA